MTGRFFVAILLVCCACADDAPEQAARGVLVLERVGPDAGRLAQLEAAGSYCARDTTFSVVASSPGWAAAIAVRSSWPTDSARTFEVDSTPRTAERAAFAARMLGDSLQAALIGRRGRIDVNGGRALAGRFEVSVMQDSTPVQLAGRFEGITVAEACP